LLASLSRALMRTGQPAKAVETADKALDLAEHLGLERVIAETFNNKGSSLRYLGRRREALVLLKAAVDAAHVGGFVAAEIRAMSNYGAQTEDPRQSRDMYRAAAELARRVGNRGLANWASVAARYGDLVLAENWDEAIAESADERADDYGSPLDQIRRLSVVGLFLGPRGESLDANIERIAELGEQVSDSSARGSLLYARAERALNAGDYGLACDEALRAAEDSPLRRIYLSLAMRPALWGRDLARARQIADLLDAEVSTGEAAEAERVAARAGVAALEGRIDDAIAGYGQASRYQRSISAAFIVACLALDLVMLIGPDQPAAREAAAEARPIFERVKARVYLERLDTALQRQPSSPSREPERARDRSSV
jgi:tetratricopeptide (TPR) repeat protein